MKYISIDTLADYGLQNKALFVIAASLKERVDYDAVRSLNVRIFLKAYKTF